MEETLNKIQNEIQKFLILQGVRPTHLIYSIPFGRELINHMEVYSFEVKREGKFHFIFDLEIEFDFLGEGEFKLVRKDKVRKCMNCGGTGQEYVPYTPKQNAYFKTCTKCQGVGKLN